MHIAKYNKHSAGGVKNAVYTIKSNYAIRVKKNNKQFNRYK